MWQIWGCNGFDGDVEASEASSATTLKLSNFLKINANKNLAYDA